MELTIKIELPAELVQGFAELLQRAGQVKSFSTTEEKDVVIVPGKLYKTKEACNILRLDSATPLNKLAKDGIIPSTKPGKDRLFLGKDLINYLENGKA